MSGALTVLRKELLELLGDRSSLRGVLVQVTILLVMAGCLMPYALCTTWQAHNPLAVLYHVILPPLTSVMIASDAFAGERERRTLETLLATPLSDRAIVVGKAGAALVVSESLTLLALVLATITVNLVKDGAGVFLPSLPMCAFALGGSFALALVDTAAAITVSSRVAVARSAQQVTSLLGLGLAGALAYGWRRLHLGMDWTTLLTACGVIALVGAAALALASAQFRRARFFEQR